MRNMFIPAIAMAVMVVPVSVGQKAKPHADSAALVARGKYLVEDVGMCSDCHTPRNEKGEPMKEQWLQGAVLGFKPTPSNS